MKRKNLLREFVSTS